MYKIISKHKEQIHCHTRNRMFTNKSPKSFPANLQYFFRVKQKPSQKRVNSWLIPFIHKKKISLEGIQFLISIQKLKFKLVFYI